MSGINCYFIRSIIDFDIFKNMVLKNKIDSNSLAVLWEASWASFFKNAGVKHIVLHDYIKYINYNRLRKRAISLIKLFPHKKILDNKSLVELLEYNGYSLWWFIRQGFFTHYVNAIKETYIVELLLKNKEIRNITILNQDEQFIDMIKEATKNYSITVNYTEPGFLTKKAYFLSNKKELILWSLPRIIRIIQGFFRHLQIKTKIKKWNILLFTRAHVWSTLSGNVRGDLNSYTIMRDMSGKLDYNTIPLDIALTRDGAWKGIKEKKRPFMPYDYFIFGSYFDPHIKKIIRFQKSRLRNLWKKLDKNEMFKKALMYSNISLYPILRQQIRSYFLSEFDSFIGAIRNIEIGKKILAKYKIDALIAVDENGSSRFLVFAAKMKNIPSIGLQHGVIAPITGSIAYNYSKNDLYLYPQNLNCQLVDKTAVFGNYFKKLLITEGNYRSDMIAITGQPRFDIFYENKKTDFKMNYYKKFGIKDGEKLVVYLSQPRKEDLIVAFSAVVKALKYLNNVKLIVKLHPADKASLYENVLQELGYGAIISKDVDLHELLNCADLVIAIHSTTILEALALEKPLIQLNLIEEYEAFGKLAAKYIKRVADESDLHNSIKYFLYGKSSPKKFVKDRKKFISEYFYKIDGKSTERFIKVLKGMLRRK